MKRARLRRQKIQRESKNRENKRFLPSTWLGLKVLLSLALLVWLGIRVDWGTTIEVLQDARPYVVALTYLLSLAVQLLLALRMLLLMRTQSIKAGYSWTLRMNFIGNFASNFMPSTVGGDLLRMAMLANVSESKSRAVVCVSVDRAINSVARLCFIPLVLHVWEGLGFNLALPHIHNFGQLALLCGGGLFSLFVLILVLILLGSLFRKAAVDPSQIEPSWIQKKLAVIAVVWWDFLLQPFHIAGTLVLSWLAALSSFLIGWVLANDVGIPLTLLDWIGVSLLLTLVSMFPITFNGVGLREAGTVFLLAHFGVSPEKATALALLLRCLSIATTVPGACWLTKRKSHSDRS